MRSPRAWVHALHSTAARAGPAAAQRAQAHALQGASTRMRRTWLDSPLVRRRLGESLVVDALGGAGSALRGAGGRRLGHVQLRLRAGLPLQRPGRVQELPHHERPVRLVAQGPAPRRRDLQRLPRAAAASLPSTSPRRATATTTRWASPSSPRARRARRPRRLRRADPDQGQEQPDPAGQLPALPRRSRPRHRPRQHLGRQRHPLRALPPGRRATARAASQRRPWRTETDRRALVAYAAVALVVAARRHRRRHRAARQHLRAQAGGEEPLPQARRGHRGRRRSRRSGASTGRASTTATGAPPSPPAPSTAAGSSAPRARSRPRRPTAIPGSRASSPATSSRSTTAIGAATPSCCRTRRSPSATCRARPSSRATACTATPRSCRSTASSAARPCPQGTPGRAGAEGPRARRRDGLLGRPRAAREDHRRRPPGLLRRLPRPEDHGAARHAARASSPASGSSPASSAPVPHLPSIERWRRGEPQPRPTTPTSTARARRCARSSAASATSSTTAARA